MESDSSKMIKWLVWFCVAVLFFSECMAAATAKPACANKIALSRDNCSRTSRLRLPECLGMFFIIRPMTLIKAERVFRPAGDRQWFVYKDNKIATAVCAKRAYGVARLPGDAEVITDSLGTCARSASAESMSYFLMYLSISA